MIRIIAVKQRSRLIVLCGIARHQHGSLRCLGVGDVARR